jgi:DNA repair protein RadA/Sms
MDQGMIAFGEVGLSGEVRAVSQAAQRVAEAKKLGFATCVLPEVSAKALKEVKGIKIIGVKSVQDVVDLI